MPSELVKRGVTLPQSVNFEHHPVLLSEAMKALNIKSGGTYVDGTFGRGGHSREILRRLGAKGRLIAIDKDPEAVEVATQIEAENFWIEHGSFRDLEAILKKLNIDCIDGVLLDLGVSSPQLQSAKRGFSFSVDGPLDMRMDPTSGLTALQWINTAPEDEITQVINNYGEERFASRIARAITNQRSDQEITTTFELKNLVSTAIPRKFHTGKEPATKTFQAIRIFLNKELDDLRYFCEHVVPLLANGARIAIISFHSLEDRIVRHALRDYQHPMFQSVCL